METLLATFAGLLVGVIFTLIKLPIPAPPYLPGVMGVVGVYVGSLLTNSVISFLYK